MKNIKKIVRTDAAFEILDNSNCAGTDWGSGGCAILAQALNKLEGYPIVVIYNLDYEGPEHFGVMTPSGTILDHDGEHKGAKAWLNFFVNNEHPREGALTVKEFTPDMNMNGIKFDSEASDKLAELIRSYNKKGFISERYEEKGFINWLSGKFGKKIGKRLGGGMFGEVYEFGPAVIKLSSRDVYDNASIANKNIPGIAKVYAHGKIIVPIQFLDRAIRGWYSLDTKDTSMTLRSDRVLHYLIMEKLDSNRKVKDEIDDVRWAIENFSKENKISGDSDLRDLFVNRNNEDYIQNLYNYIQNNFSKSDAIKVSEIMVELISIFRSVGKFYNWLDVHPGQFGRNSKGELVAFDLDNPKESYSNFDKHLVREKMSENKEIIRKIVRKVLREEREVEGINDKTKLSVFDFDSTLVMTPVPETGAQEWEEKTGEPWQGRWWDNPNSLDINVFEMPVNPVVISAYRREKSNPHNLVVMLTGRNQKMSKYVENILDKHGLVFDDYLYNDGGETSSNKLMKMELALKYNPNIRAVEMWDDRDSHIPLFQRWGDAMVEQGYLDSFNINHVK